MLILITKDGTTVIAREVASLEEAKGFADAGFHVEVETEDGRKPLADMLAAADNHVQPAPEAEQANDQPAAE